MTDFFVNILVDCINSVVICCLKLLVKEDNSILNID